MTNFLSFYKRNKELLIGILIPCSFLILYYLSVFFISEYVYLIGSLFFISIITSFFIQKDTFSCFFLLFALFICLPTISHPITILPQGLDSIIEEFFLYSDRISLRSIGILIISSFSFLLLALKLLANKSKLFISLAFSLFAFLAIIFSHSYENLSIYQVFMDFGQIIACISIIIFFRSLKPSKELKARGLSYINLIFGFLAIFLIFDLLLTFSGLISWSYSYRDTIQGAFYYSELNYSFFLGIGFIYLVNKLNLNYFSFTIFIAFFTFVIFLTAIKTAALAFLIACLIVPIFKYKYLNTLLLPIVIASLILLIISLLGLDEANSLIVRFFTYYLYFWTIFDGTNIIFGIMPGVHDVTIPSNLSLYFFDAGYVELLTGFPEALVAELVDRSEYDEGGAFLPHNSLLAAVSSYGIIVFFHSLYYLYYSPYWLIKNIRVISLDGNDYLISMVIFFAILAVFHPVMHIAILIFIIEFLNFAFLDKKE